MAKLFKKKDGSTVVKSADGKIVNNLPAPPGLANSGNKIVSNIPLLPGQEQSNDNISSLQKFSTIIAPVEYESETAQITPVNGGNIPAVSDVEIAYYDGADAEQLHWRVPPRVYLENFDWKESFLTSHSNADYDTKGLKHWDRPSIAAAGSDPEILQAVLTENVKSKLSNPAFQGVDGEDPTPYLVVSKDMTDIAKIIKSNPESYTQQEIDAANKIVDNMPIKGVYFDTNSVNPAMVEKRGGSYKLTKEADAILAAGERMSQKRSADIINLKNKELNRLPMYKNLMKRGMFGGYYSNSETSLVSGYFENRGHHRVPRASQELKESRDKVSEVNQEMHRFMERAKVEKATVPIAARMQWSKEKREQKAQLDARKEATLKEQAAYEARATSMSRIVLGH
jgi:hypothetical protein